MVQDLFETQPQTQEDKILQYLQSGKSITPIEALNLFGCFRLGARCYDLKKKGYDIKSTLVRGESGKHFSKYYI